MTDILVTTLGGTWQILPELMGLTNPDLVDLFKYHPRIENIEQGRKKYGISPVKEFWVVTTYGKKAEEGLEEIAKWYDRLDKNSRPLLKIWQVSDTNNLSTEDECKKMCEAIHTIVFNARHHSKNGKLFLSLTGGRKTMSTDLQNAAAWFGCDAIIHIIDNPNPLELLGIKPYQLTVQDLLEPAKPEYKDFVTPFIIGKYEANPILSVAKSGSSRLSIDIDKYSIFPTLPVTYSLLHELPSKPIRLDIDPSFPLTSTLDRLKADAGYLMCNYANTMLKGNESQTNFLALYSLPEEKIVRLKSWKMGVDPAKEDEELSFLKKLPKAELHCHLGGVANADELIKIASAATDDINKYADPPESADLLRTWLSPIKEWIKERNAKSIKEYIGSLKGVREIKDNWNVKELSAKVPSFISTASFIMLFCDAPELLDEVIYGEYVDESKFCNIGFTHYEELGDLQGSGLLQNQACLKEACRVIAEKAIAQNVSYLEVRCSPVNYSLDGNLSSKQVYKIIQETLAEYQDRLYCSIIFIASRHGDFKKVRDHVELAKEILKEEQNSKKRVALRGFDLAGDEGACKASEMREPLMPVMEQCLHFTIHAGENQQVQSIWEAVYHLNAERIGHSLTLNENRELMERFLDRNIVLEMCPSSNFQIIGYCDNYYQTTNHLKIYPLKEYLEKGLRVTVNTDNTGISRTDFSKELHRACRLTPQGLSVWEILCIIRNSFKAAFAPRDIRHRMLREAEESVVKLLRENNDIL
ncbi:MAG: hypothetical protein HQK63_10850 [Desulfamplus sp.]|nr:hypothetical protein [Desulfamplus sp.]